MTDTDFPCRVRRLRLALREGRWQLVKNLSIPRMTIPRSKAMPEGGKASMPWIEAIGETGEVLYRRPLELNPELGHEVSGPGGSLTRMSLQEGQEILVDVLVPDAVPVRELRLYGGHKAEKNGRRRGEVSMEPVASFRISPDKTE